MVNHEGMNKDILGKCTNMISEVVILIPRKATFRPKANDKEV